MAVAPLTRQEKRKRPCPPPRKGVAEWRDDPPASLWGWAPLGVGVTLATLGLWPVGITAFFFGRRALVGAEQEAARERLAPEPGEMPSLLIYTAGPEHAETGRDWAVVQIVDGWLVARGALADWAVGPWDVRLDPLLGRVEYADGRSMFLPASPVGPEALRAWHAGPMPVGDSVAPPTRVTRRARAAAGAAVVSRLLCLGAIPAIGRAVLGPEVRGPSRALSDAAVFLLTVTLVLAAAVAGWSLVLAWRRRTRLATLAPETASGRPG